MIFGRGIGFAQQNYHLQNVSAKFKYVKKSLIPFLPLICCDGYCTNNSMYIIFAYCINVFKSETDKNVCICQ